MRNSVFLCVAALAIACPAPAPNPASRDVSTASAFCTSLRDVWADRAVRCVGVTEAYLSVVWPTEEPSMCADMAAAVARGATAYSGADASDCLAAMAALSCDDDLEEVSLAGCERVLQGRLEPGSACVSSLECAAGSCEFPGTGCTGTCVADLAAGDACGAPPAECGAGLVCDLDATGTCVPPAPAAVGAPCGPGDLPCVSGAFCDGGACAAKRPAFASCFVAGTNVVESDACGAGTTCHQDSYFDATRAECIPWVRVGAACGEWVGNCVPGAHCSTAGTCVDDGRVGGACERVGDCLDGWCNTATHVCESPKGVGEACTAWDQCGFTAYCTGYGAAGVCAVPSPSCP